MPIDIQWDDDAHTIIRVEMPGSSTWHEYHQAIETVVQQMRTVSYRVDLIFAVTNSMPAGNPIPHLKSGMSKLEQEANYGVIATITGENKSGYTMQIMSAVIRIYKLDVKHSGGFYTSLEDARAAIARLHASETIG